MQCVVVHAEVPQQSDHALGHRFELARLCASNARWPERRRFDLAVQVLTDGVRIDDHPFLVDQDGYGVERVEAMQLVAMRGDGACVTQLGRETFEREREPNAARKR